LRLRGKKKNLKYGGERCQAKEWRAQKSSTNEPEGKYCKNTKYRGRGVVDIVEGRAGKKGEKNDACR